MKMKIKIFIGAVALLFSTVKTEAQDRSFAYTYQSLTLGKGIRDIEFWNTVRNGKSNFYRAIDSRLEFETGVANNLQTSFYLNLSQTQFWEEDSTGASGQMQTEPTSLSFSNEWKLKLSDPVANGIGTGLYFEIGVGLKEIELEGKIILDKKIGKQLFAFNAVGEFEIEYSADKNSEVVSNSEWHVEQDFGWLYQVKNCFGFGIEARNSGVIDDNELEMSSLFIGPTISFTGEKFWLIISAQPQIVNLKSAKHELDFDDHTKQELRAIVSFSF